MEKSETIRDSKQIPTDEIVRYRKNLISHYENEKESDSRLDDSSMTSVSIPSQIMKVYLRMRPFPPKMKVTRAQEEAYRIINSTTMLAKIPGLDGNAGSTKKPKGNETLCRRFTFTKTFGPETSQFELFERAIKQQMVDFLAGHNSTVMSYGTTNAGKSYTMLGTTSSPGMIPYAIEFLFSHTTASPSPCYKPVNQGHVVSLSLHERAHEMETTSKLLSFGLMERSEYTEAYESVKAILRERSSFAPRQSDDTNYSVWISFAEIYNEIVYDLLSNDCQDKKPPLKMVTDRQGRTFVKGLRSVCVNSGVEAYQILMTGYYKLNVAATALNDRSSRSHCIFTIKLLKYFEENAHKSVEMSTFSFCDLAGSGRLKKILNGGKHLKETQNINTGMLVFGRCLRAISDSQSVRQKTIGPFRESKLTRLFQKALSGKERISLIVNVNPVPNLYVETQSVLNCSAIAKKIVVEPAKDAKKKTLGSRFSQMVSRSVKTITDWDSTGLESRPQTPEKIDYRNRGSFDKLSDENEKLRGDLAALKESFLTRDFEIRQEMTDIYTGMMKELENSWKAHTKDAEERQEDLLSWSVKQVENFYKEKLNQVEGRKRKRMDNCYQDDGEAATIQELEAENSFLTSTVVSLKESVHELRDDRKKLCTEKNKGVFELAIMKDELRTMRTTLQAAQNDICCDEKATHLNEELQKQLYEKEDLIRTLKELLNEAKDDYVRITSDAAMIEEKLKGMHAIVLENAKRIEDLEKQVVQGNICLVQQTERAEKLEEILDDKSRELDDAEDKARVADNKLSELESENSILLRKLQEIEMDSYMNRQDKTLESQDLSKKLLDVRNEAENLKEKLLSKEELVFDLKSKLIEVESEACPLREKLQRCNDEINLFKQDLKATKVKIEDVSNQIESLRGSEYRKIETNDSDIQTSFSIDNVERSEKENQTSFRFSDSSSKDDSGIAVTVESGNQTMDLINVSNCANTETEEISSQVNFVAGEKYDEIQDRLEQLKLDHSELSTQYLYENLRVKEISQELEDAKCGMETLRVTFDENKCKIAEYENTIVLIESELKSVRVDKEEREKELAGAIQALEMMVSVHDDQINGLQHELKVSQERELLTSKDLDEYLEKATSLESQLSVAYVQLDKISIKCFTEHVPRIEKLEKEIADAKSREEHGKQSLDDNTEKILKLEEELAKTGGLKERVAEFEYTLGKCRKEKENLLRQMEESFAKLSSLEKELQEWVLEKEYEISCLQTELKNIIRRNETNSEFIKEMEKDIEDTLRQLTATREELSISEEARKTLEQEKNSLEARLKVFEENATSVTLLHGNVEARQAELEKLRTELDEKEHEMNVFRKNRDETIQRYEALVKQFQEDAEKSKLEAMRFHKLFLKRTANKEETKKLEEGLRSECNSSELPQDNVDAVAEDKGSHANTSYEGFVAPMLDNTPAVEHSGPATTVQTNKLMALPSIEFQSPDVKRPSRKKTLFVKTDEVCIDLEPNGIGDKPDDEAVIRPMGRTVTNSIRISDLSGSDLKQGICGRTAYVAPQEFKKPNRKMTLIVKTDEVCVDLEPNEGYMQGSGKADS